jgi:hypothetical protein
LIVALPFVDGGAGLADEGGLETLSEGVATAAGTGATGDGPAGAEVGLPKGPAGSSRRSTIARETRPTPFNTAGTPARLAALWSKYLERIGLRCPDGI